jgi:heme/copper-type cytochrome/quinol oxidase subunit 2
MEIRDCFHDLAIRVVLFITGFILVRIIDTVRRGYFSRMDGDRDLVETVWTLLPGVTLIFLVVPRLVLLYSREEVYRPRIRLRAMGHQ